MDLALLTKVKILIAGEIGLSPNEVKNQDRLTWDLKMDEFDRELVAIKAEETFDIDTIPETELIEANTVEDFAGLIEEMLARRDGWGYA